jgi:A nuclease family of the HNH/ENDO VII superfamily with conserved AHH
MKKEANRNFYRITTFLILLLSLFLSISCQQEEISAIQEANYKTISSQTISTNEVLNEVINSNIKKYISELSISLEKSQNKNFNLSLFTKIIKENQYITYSFLVNKYSQEKPYFTFFVIQKTTSIEKAGFAKYIPANAITNLDVPHFTGILELYDIDYTLYARTSFVNGQAIPTPANTASKGQECGNVISIITHNCSHGGNHSPGQSCNNGYSNDGYYEVIIRVVCHTVNSITPPPDAYVGQSGGGSANGGGLIPDVDEIFAFTESLTVDEQDWLAQNLPTYNTLINNLVQKQWSEESKDIAKELISLGREEVNQQDVNSLINLSLKIEQNSDQLFEDDFITSLDPYIDLDLASNPPGFSPIYNLIGLKTFLNYKKLRILNPEWSRGKCLWNASKEIVHISLDTFGLIPVAGEIADLANGVLYTIEGDGLNATLSYASAIPIAGWAASGTKFGLRVINVANDINSKVKLVWKVGITGVEFGNRAQLRKVLGIVSSNFQAHHIIPWAKSSNEVVQKAARSSNAFHMNEALNGIPLGTLAHSGSHAAYDQRVLNGLNEIKALYGPNMTPQQAYNGLTNLIHNIRTAILNNPNTPINQLIF